MEPRDIRLVLRAERGVLIDSRDVDFPWMKRLSHLGWVAPSLMRPVDDGSPFIEVEWLATDKGLALAQAYALGISDEGPAQKEIGRREGFQAGVERGRTEGVFELFSRAVNEGMEKSDGRIRTKLIRAMKPPKVWELAAKELGIEPEGSGWVARMLLSMKERPDVAERYGFKVTHHEGGSLTASFSSPKSEP